MLTGKWFNRLPRWEKRKSIHIAETIYEYSQCGSANQGEAVSQMAVRYNIEKKDEKPYTLTVTTADRKWLQATRRRQYPVYDDPFKLNG